ncbi:P-loop containing nucleoside triphosphate hydrolase protein, partial [Lyophyllum atratum]
IMGSTGAGKSTFVNTLMGKDVASVGNDLESHTKHVQHFTFTDPAFPERRIVVIDTPGFDDTYINNREILRRIAVWLARSYDASMKLAGIIYLHKITNNRVAGTTRNTFDLFEKLCGKNASEKIVLVTTMWSLVSKEAGERREEQMRDKFWKDMLALGSSMIRLNDSDMQRSAQNIIKRVLAKDILDPLQIQHEMFVNILMGKAVASVGNDLESHTAEVQHFIYTHSTFPKGRIILIDTPGFDDTYIDDREILRRIAIWLARSYDENMKLAGVIYLHRISDNRMSGSARKNLDLFEKLCGKNAAERIVLATTMWSRVSPEDGARRETQMTEKFWKDMVSHGSSLKRLDGTQSSALGIVDFILTKDIIDPVPLLIQQEMVDTDKIFEKTEAARHLSSYLQDLLQKQEEKARELRQKGGGGELQQALLENDARIRETISQMKALDVSITGKVMRFFGLSRVPRRE